MELWTDVDSVKDRSRNKLCGEIAGDARPTFGDVVGLRAASYGPRRSMGKGGGKGGREPVKVDKLGRPLNFGPWKNGRLVSAGRWEPALLAHGLFDLNEVELLISVNRFPVFRVDAPTHPAVKA